MQKAILITGASSGIGKASALLLDKLGYRVFAGVRREEDGVEIVKTSSGNLIPVIIDITDNESIKNTSQRIASILNEQGLFALVNNAGIAVAGPLEFMPVEKIREQFEVNVIGHIAVTQAFLPLLRRGKGRIINMSSKEGIISMPFVGPYCASKFALEALSDSLRMELKQWDIPVSIIEPGTIATEIIEKSIVAAEDGIKKLPRHASELYESCFDKARCASNKIAESAIPVNAVAKVVAKAVTDKKPRLRYTVGMDAGMLAILKRIMPGWMLDKLILRQLGL